MKFGERLCEERKRLKLNQTEFGNIAGVTKASQVNYESGERSPNAEYLQAIAAAGADVQYILTGIRSQQTQTTPPTNYINLNKKKIEKVMEDLTPEQQAEVIKVAEEKQRMNWFEVELNTLKKQVG